MVLRDDYHIMHLQCKGNQLFIVTCSLSQMNGVGVNESPLIVSCLNRCLHNVPSYTLHKVIHYAWHDLQCISKDWCARITFTVQRCLTITSAEIDRGWKETIHVSCTSLHPKSKFWVSSPTLSTERSNDSFFWVKVRGQQKLDLNCTVNCWSRI